MRAVPALRRDAGAGRGLAAALLSRRYDPRSLPAPDKGGATIGMAMTEKQGGSDVRANTTRGRAGRRRLFELVGHKWFCSAPMSDAFLTLAQAPDGLDLLPRAALDAGRRAQRASSIERLKDKLGNRSNASAEIEYRRRLARPVGEPRARRRAPSSRWCTTPASTPRWRPAGMMRAALVAGACTTPRTAAPSAAARRAAADGSGARRPRARGRGRARSSSCASPRALRRGRSDRAALSRIGSALAKFWVNKRLPQSCLRGDGVPRRQRLCRGRRRWRASTARRRVNSIWEGSGNVIALDVLRALAREPQALEALRTEMRSASGADGRGSTASSTRSTRGLQVDRDEGCARRLVEDMALALQASLMLRHAPAPWRRPSSPPASAGVCAAATARYRPASRSTRSSSGREWDEASREFRMDAPF